MRTVYALLVGIDGYVGDVSPLRGCVNDVDTLERLLPTLLDPVETTLRVRTLRNTAATRTAVIDAFREHFAAAGPGDIALFCFAGHGALQRSGWAGAAPGAQDETLVLHDSRSPGSWDLADRELRVLAEEVTVRGAGVVAVHDSCHSGGTLREDDPDIGIRLASTDARPRPAETYLSSTRSVTGATGDAPDYVLLAACASHQTAKEKRIDGVWRGAFSAALQAVMVETRGRATYADLVAVAAARVGGLVRDQNPRVESGDPGAPRRIFLSDVLAPPTRAHRVVHDVDGWRLEAGRLHGIPTPRSDRTVLLSIRIPHTDTEVAKARVTSVEPARSRIDVGTAALDPAALYSALVTAWPTPRTTVALAGAPEHLAAVRDALTASRLAVEVAESPEIEVDTTVTGFRVVSPQSGLRLAHEVDGHDVDAALQVADAIELMARWRLLRDLANPASAISSGEVEIRVETAAGVVDGAGPLEVGYTTAQDGAETAPPLRISVRNLGQVRRFVALLVLSPQYGVANLLGETAGMWIGPGDTLDAAGGAELVVTLPDELFAAGVTVIEDRLLAIVSTAEFEPRELCQEGLDARLDRSPADRAVADSALDQLLAAATRNITPRATNPAVDWQVVTRLVRVRRPGPGTAIIGGSAVDLGGGVGVTAPAGLAGRARLTSLEAVARDVSTPPLPPALDDPAVSLPLLLSADRGDGDLSVLEIRVDAGADVVSQATPLQLELPTPPAADEHVLAVAHDGDYWLPVGHATRIGDRSVVSIIALPSSVESERGLWTSVRVVLRKLVGSRIGLRYDHPILTAARPGDGVVTHHADVAAAVGDAANVLLTVHGIIGDTRGMVDWATGAGTGHDAVLAFDYESLHTTVEETSRDLRDRLVAAGFGPDRQVDVVAHSMGGLVVRWLVEREGGAGLVRRAVLAGTPHAGSPWPTVQGWATTALALALNGLAPVAWPATVLGGLVQAFEAIDNALDSLQPGSPLLANLAAGADPGVPYTLLVGDRSSTDQDRVAGLLARLQKTVGNAAALVFAGEANDIAVSVSSAADVPVPRSPAPEAVRVACDHFSYFTSPAGRAALEAALSVGPS